jgi:adenylosuccinate lyase
MSQNLFAIAPVDGRYARHTTDINAVASEAGLIRYRLMVEVEWFIGLAEHPDFTALADLTADQKNTLRDIYRDLKPAYAERVKAIEKTTNHDVKAIEYFLQETFAPDLPDGAIGFFHFACTSEDINSTAYALMLRDLNTIAVSGLHDLLSRLSGAIAAWKDIPMLCFTHGQPASPSVLGKEIGMFAVRLLPLYQNLTNATVMAKLNGAIGNYNAHLSAYPALNWPELARKVLEQQLGLEQNPFTTQIEPHDGMAATFDNLSRLATVLIDMSRDIWQYISLEYFRQKTVASEVGSSTMPHKVNPIDFENAEGNLMLARNLWRFLADKLPISRLQRDLTDSTTLRNVGTAYGHLQIALKSLARGLAKLEVNARHMEEVLNHHWELLAEPLQTVMKKNGMTNAYELIKQESRGKKWTRESYQALVKKAGLQPADEALLLDLTPHRYTGRGRAIAEEMCDKLNEAL